MGFPDVSLIEPLAKSLGITITELFKGERIENGVDNESESLLADIVKVSAKGRYGVKDFSSLLSEMQTGKFD